MLKSILAVLGGVAAYMAYRFNPKEVRRRRVAKYKTRLNAVNQRIIKARMNNNETLLNQLLAERKQILEEMRLLGT